MTDGFCRCSSWVIDYGHDLKKGEHHHRGCKMWHRVIGNAILTKTEFMVLGVPDDDDETHNCDAMGCGTFSHVLVRLPLSAIQPAPEPVDQTELREAVEQEPLTRFCPGCGSVGTVDARFLNCCPDFSKARMIPERLATECHGLFELAIAAHPEQVAQDRLAWLHSPESSNVDGYEWGIFRVKWEGGAAVDVQHTYSDFSDLDAARANAQEGRAA